LLFSPRPAWLWDADRRAFLWANAAARARFGGDLNAFQSSLPAATILRLAAIARWKRRMEATGERLDFGGKPAASLSCNLERLKLSDGHAGLLVAEALEEKKERRDRAGTASGEEARRGQSKTAGKRALRSERRDRSVPLRPAPAKAAPAPAAHAAAPLAADDLAAFKAVGRKVRRLCREKVSAATHSVSRPAIQQPEQAPQANKPERPAPQLPTPGAAIVQAFDALFRLSADGLIVSASGRLCRSAGWTPRIIEGQEAAALATAKDRERLEKLLQKGRERPERANSAEILLEGRDGQLLPSRLVLVSESGEGDQGIWMAAISLKMSPRLLRAVLQSREPNSPSREAA
jgi:PAS domain S-box-containing protein